MNMVLGIGNVDRADDGIGPLVASMIKLDGWQALDCGTVPENFTGVVRRTRPDLVVLVDAVDMNAAAGEIRVLEAAKLHDVNVGTHAMSLAHLAQYLSDLAGRIILVGIQPKNVTYGEPMCDEVREAAGKVVAMITRGELAG